MQGGAKPKKAAPAAAPTRAKKQLMIPFVSHVTLADKIFFIDNLRVMLRAGLPLSRAFEILGMQTESAYFRTVITATGTLVERGTTLAEALSQYPKIFAPIMVNMVRVGEISGSLERSLEQIGLQMKKDAALRSKVRGALAYPIVVVMATLGIGVAMMIFVVPKILSIFSEVQISLPVTTRILIAVANAFQNHGVLVGIGALITVVAIVLAYRSAPGKRFFQMLFIRFPIIGPIVRKVNLARFTRTFSSLLKSDVPVVDACMVTASVLGNVHFRGAVQRAAESVKRGVTVSEALAASPLFPPLVTQMAAVGESSGSLDELLGEVAVFYEGQVDETMGNFAQIIEPLLIIVLGIAVGGMAFAIISPIYTLAQNISI